jgi:hypothetical protein
MLAKVTSACVCDDRATKSLLFLFECITLVVYNIALIAKAIREEKPVHAKIAARAIHQTHR